MLIIPAIDLKDGNCVRLSQGKLENEIIYSTNPVEMAEKWEMAGAKYLHLVDLDGAFKGSPQNKLILKKIVQTVKIPVQIGGGIRELDTIKEYLSWGTARIILGTKAFHDHTFVEEACQSFPNKIVAGIDAYGGNVAIKGWTEMTMQKAWVLAKRMEEVGISAIICTDISSDGMLRGPNLDSIQEMMEKVTIPVIASGGVTTLKDIQNLMTLGRESSGLGGKKELAGVIVGKSIYSGSLNLADAIKLAQTKAKYNY